jgi:Ca2+-binding RTX toxin-like protein
MRSPRPKIAVVSAAAVFASVACTGAALGDASHAGWPAINGELRMHKSDQNGPIHGTGRSDELLGGHGDDQIDGGSSGDVIWGDYKPCCQPTSQRDVLVGEAGRDYIYASHGYNDISAGAGDDVVHGHFGRGAVDCGSGRDLLYLSHRSRPGYRIRHCERISYHSNRG